MYELPSHLLSRRNFLHKTAEGLDHERLTWYYNGLEQSLTGFEGKGVIAELLS